MDTRSADQLEATRLARRALAYTSVWPVLVTVIVLRHVQGGTWSRGLNDIVLFIVAVVGAIGAIRVGRIARHRGAPNRSTAVAAEAIGWFEATLSVVLSVGIAILLYLLSRSTFY